MPSSLAAAVVPFGAEEQAQLASAGFVVLPDIVTPAGLQV